MKSLRDYYEEMRLRGGRNIAARAVYYLGLAAGRMRRLPAREPVAGEFLQFLKPGTAENVAEFLALHDGKPRPWKEVPQALVLPAIEAAADSVADQHFSFAGGDFFFPDKVDWHHCLTVNKSFPRAHWSQIPFRTLRGKYDTKPCRAMNRHAFFTSLALAWAKTGNIRYAAVLARFLNDWCDQNTPETGIHYSSGAEIGLRCLAWIQADRLMRGCPAYDEDTRMRLHCNLYAQARHIAAFLPATRRQAADFRLVCESACLALIALQYPEWKDGGAWLEQGLSTLDAALDAQITRDGMHFETSFGYHLLVTELVLMLLAEMRLRRMPLPEKIRALLERMVDVLEGARQPDGSLPGINDNEDMHAMPLQLEEGERLRGIFAAAAVLYARADLKSAAGDAWNVYAHLLLGEEGAEDFRLQPSHAAAPRALVDLPGNGLCILRHGRDYALLKNTPDPFPRSGHNHADLLHMILFMDGRPVLVDAGTYRYAADRGLRDALRGTMAHNTVTVDRRPQARPGLAFGWTAPLKAGPMHAVDNRHFAFAEGRHDSYESLGVAHRRIVLHFKEERLWAVIDTLEGDDAHYFEQFWHFPPGTRADALDDGHFQVADAQGGAVHMHFLCEGDHDAHETVMGSPQMPWSYVSPRYGHIAAGVTLRHGWTSNLTPGTPARRVTLLGRDARRPPFAIVDEGVFDISGWRVNAQAAPIIVEQAQ